MGRISSVVVGFGGDFVLLRKKEIAMARKERKWIGSLDLECARR